MLKAPLELAAGKGNNRGLGRKLVGAETGTALHAAVGVSHEDIVNDLLEGGAPLDGKDAEGKTPLHVAAKSGETAMVELLDYCSNGRTIWCVGP